jgi:hypothetical protein
MNRIHALACATLLGLASAASAQLKPPSAENPPLPPSAAEEQRNEAQAFKELAARVIAERWVALIDAGEYGKAWDQCAKVFREKVTRQQWVEGIPKSREPFGAMKTRRVEVSSFKPTLAGMPDGEYVTVRFATTFEKQQDVPELITLVYEGGAWRPLGYRVG